jgi:hypothetical protein
MVFVIGTLINRSKVPTVMTVTKISSALPKLGPCDLRKNSTLPLIEHSWTISRRILKT